MRKTLEPIHTQRQGSAAILSVTVFGTLSLLALTALMGRYNTQKVALQSGQINRELDTLVGEIANFLKVGNICQANFGKSFSSGQLSVSSLVQSDGTTVRYDTLDSNPSTTYLQGRVVIQRISLSSFVPDPANPTARGTGTVTLFFKSLAQKFGSALLTRTFPLEMQVDGSMNITGCSAIVHSDRFWVGSEANAYYAAGNVGVGATGVAYYPSQALSVNTDANHVNLLVGSAQKGIAFTHDDGCGGMILKNSPNILLGFRTDPTQNPVVMGDDPNQLLGINYPLGTALTPNQVQIRSIDTTPWVGFRTIGTNAEWTFAPSATNDLILSAKNTSGTPIAYICHPNVNSGAASPCFYNPGQPNDLVDVRIGSIASRPNTSLNFWVAGEAHGQTAWNAGSDRRLKTDIEPLHQSLEEVHKLNGYFFRWKDPKYGKGRELGLIAQELVENHVAEELADCAGEHCMLQYAPLTALLTKATQDLRRKQKSWAEKIERLRSSLGVDEPRLNALGESHE